MMEVFAHFVLMVLVLIPSYLIAVSVVRLPWLPSVLFTFGHFVQTTRAVCGALATAIAHRDEPVRVLRGARLRMPWRDRDRLDRVLDVIEHDPDALVDVMRSERLLPGPVIADLAAAQGIGHEAFASSCRRNARFPSASQQEVQVYLALLIPYVWIMGSVLLFIGAFIVPKFEQIFAELGVKLSALFEAIIVVMDVLASPLVFPLVFIALAVLPKIIMVIWHQWQPFAKKLRLGQLLVDGLNEGLPEQRLADMLMAAGQPKPTMQRAAEAGDFSALARACGWPVTSPQSLRSAVAAAEVRARRRAAVAASLARVLIPFILAVPVLLVCYAIFEALYGIVVVLAS